MIRLQEKIVIGRPIAVVFAYLTDPATISTWQSTVVEARVEGDGPLRAGSRMIETRKFLGKRIHGMTKVVDYEPARRFVIEASGPIPLRVTSSLAEEDGSTQVDMVVEGDPGGLFRFGERFVVRAARHELRKNLAALKRILEDARE